MKPHSNGADPNPLPRPGPAARLAGRFLALLLRLLGATWRRRTEGLEALDGMVARGEKVLAVFWHGGYLPLFLLLAGRPARILTSRSFRGEVIAAICRRFGYHGGPIPHHAGGSAFDAIYRALDGCRLAALAVDGPLGPFHVVKSGAVRIASGLGYSVLPVAAAGRPCQVLVRRWDRMEIPHPFAGVALVCAPAIRIPPGLTDEEVEAWRLRLGEALEAAGRRAVRMAEERGKKETSRE